jgi:hypothetical protein
LCERMIARVALLRRRKLYYLKGIVEHQWIKNRFQVMISVVAFTNYVQPEVDLTVGEDDHGLRGFLKNMF